MNEAIHSSTKLGVEWDELAAAAKQGELILSMQLKAIDQEVQQLLGRGQKEEEEARVGSGKEERQKEGARGRLPRARVLRV